MYKIKIINYQPYEYELLQDLLNDLSSQGYEANHLHFITLFKKTNQKYNYIVDLFQPYGESRFDKNASKDRFMDPYMERDYEAIYMNKGLYVFKGKQKTPPIKWNEKNFVTNKKVGKYGLFFLITAIITTFYALLLQESININSFLTYGLTFLYGGCVILAISLLYKFYLQTYYLLKLKKDLKEKGKYLKKSVLNRHHWISLGLVFMSILLIAVGFIEDGTNRQNITINDYPTVTLKDLNISDQSTVSYIKQKSFTVKEFYKYLEMSDDEKHILLTKTYDFHSSKKTNQIFDDYKSHPEEYYCDTIETKDNIIYGYTESQLTCIVIKDDTSIHMISFSFDINDDQIQTIINTYK